MSDYHIGGLVQDCSNSIATPLELLQSCTKPSISEISENCGINPRNLLNLLHGICQNHHYVDNHDTIFSYFDRLTCNCLWTGATYHQAKVIDLYFILSIFSYKTLKIDSCHDANIAVLTGDSIGCCYDNLDCHQWPQNWHHDNSRLSVESIQVNL